MIENFAGAVDLGAQGVTGIKFHNEDVDKDIFVMVNDKFPQMGAVHVEGRRFVEVSVEMFMVFMEQNGFVPVAPDDSVGGN